MWRTSCLLNTPYVAIAGNDYSVTYLNHSTSFCFLLPPASQKRSRSTELATRLALTICHCVFIVGSLFSFPLCHCIHDMLLSCYSKSLIGPEFGFILFENERRSAKSVIICHMRKYGRGVSVGQFGEAAQASSTRKIKKVHFIVSFTC